MISDYLQNNSSREHAVTCRPALNIKSKRLDLMPIKNLPAGQRFGKLTILSVGTPIFNDSGVMNSTSLCVCDCGTRKEIRNASLKSGATTSCGCYHSEQSRAKAIHGYNREGKRHPIYDVWAAMLRRCQNPRNPAYKYYGARGISVCERWQTFTHFLEDMLPSYRSDLQIERIDNNKGYCKENCKWDTRRAQMLNRRNARMVTFDGQTLNLSLWAEKTGIGFHILDQRIGKLGWSVQRALTTPVARRLKK